MLRALALVAVALAGAATIAGDSNGAGAPRLILISQAGEQEAAPGSGCFDQCVDRFNWPPPHAISVVRPGEVVRIALRSATVTEAGGVFVFHVGCPFELPVAQFELRGRVTEWRAPLASGLYEIHPGAAFVTDEGRVGDTSGTFGLLVDANRPLEVLLGGRATELFATPSNQGGTAAQRRVVARALRAVREFGSTAVRVNRTFRRDRDIVCLLAKAPNEWAASRAFWREALVAGVARDRIRRQRDPLPWTTAQIVSREGFYDTQGLGFSKERRLRIASRSAIERAFRRGAAEDHLEVRQLQFLHPARLALEAVVVTQNPGALVAERGRTLEHVLRRLRLAFDRRPLVEGVFLDIRARNGRSVATCSHAVRLRTVDSWVRPDLRLGPGYRYLPDCWLVE